MLTAAVEQLLILQDRDARCDHIKKQLAAIPAERSEVQREIAAEEAAVQAAEDAIRHLQAQAKELEGVVADAEARIVKYKTQQLEVKKNEEYQAFEHEIETLRAKIAEHEDEELVLLEEIDVKQAAVKAQKAEFETRTATFQARLKTLDEGEANYQGQLDEAENAVTAARAETGAEALKTYDFVRGQVRRPPYLSPIEAGKCMGCHLRVSGEVDSAARRGSGLVRCSSCGRIVYIG